MILQQYILIHANDQWRLILTLDEDEDGKVVIVIEVVDYH